MNKHNIKKDYDETDNEEEAVRKFFFEELLYHKVYIQNNLSE